MQIRVPAREQIFDIHDSHAIRKYLMGRALYFCYVLVKGYTRVQQMVSAWYMITVTVFQLLLGLCPDTAPLIMIPCN